MAHIIPFNALRPTRSKANLIASRPFYTYKKNLLSAKLEGNPYTFLHVINPEFRLDDKTTPNSKERFEKVKEKFQEFKDLGYFIKDSLPHFYIYRQRTLFGEFIGIIAAASIHDFKNGLIKPHEKTLTKRENTFKLYLDICKFHAEPVLLSYKDEDDINKIIEKQTLKRAEYEFSTTDNKDHELWIIDDKNEIDQLIKAFEKVNSVYIADGHHRIASSILYGDSKKHNDHFANHFLSFFIAESKLKIFEYNRFIKSIDPLSKNELIDKLQEQFIVEPIENERIKKPSRKHEFTMYLNKKWYLLNPKDGVIEKDHPTFSLDTNLLSELILKPILQINDLKNDERVDFFNGARDYHELTEMGDKNKNSVIFCLYPHTIEELKKVADISSSMPPKSTWIEPKLRSGLIVYEY